MGKPKTYEAIVKITKGKSVLSQKMTVQADNPSMAKLMLEKQWGKNKVRNIRKVG